MIVDTAEMSPRLALEVMRLAAGYLSWREFSKASGIPINSIQGYLSGTYSPSLGWRRRLAAALGVDVKDLSKALTTKRPAVINTRTA
jgi:transcriptional regulator with XRE-family HTH domain